MNLSYAALRIDEHQYQQRDDEDYRENNRNLVQVLLNNARARLRRVQRTCDGVRNARSFAGMQHNKNDQASAGYNEGDYDDDK